MDADQIALEELRLIQRIIERQEDTRFRIRNWVVTLQAGIALAYLSDELSIEAWSYAVVALAVLTMFLLLEGVYAVAETRAIQRSAAVEDVLRSMSGYDGPWIADSMDPDRGGRRIALGAGVHLILRQTLRPRILLAYIVLAGLVAVVAIAGR